MNSPKGLIDVSINRADLGEVGGGREERQVVSVELMGVAGIVSLVNNRWESGSHSTCHLTCKDYIPVVYMNGLTAGLTPGLPYILLDQLSSPPAGVCFSRYYLWITRMHIVAMATDDSESSG